MSVLDTPVTETPKKNGVMTQVGPVLEKAGLSKANLDAAKTRGSELAAKGKDMALTAGAKGKELAATAGAKVQAAGTQTVAVAKKRPMAAALAVLGLGAAAVLIANPRTRGKALAAGAGALKLAQSSGLALPGLAAIGGFLGLSKAKPV